MFPLTDVRCLTLDVRPGVSRVMFSFLRTQQVMTDETQPTNDYFTLEREKNSIVGQEIWYQTLPICYINKLNK